MKAQRSDAPQDFAGATTEAAPPAHVLIVEDNIDLATTLQVLLEMEGHSVIVAHRGDVALAIAKSRRLDVVFCDIGLPGADGYEVAAALRRMPRHRHTVLVAVTGYGDRQSRHKALAAGFDVHFTKPVPPGCLLDILEHTLRGTPRKGSAASKRPH
jgi:CheY-like chemotaxis protein